MLIRIEYAVVDIFLTLAVVGLIINLLAFKQVYRDIKWIRSVGINGTRMAIAQGDLRRELFRISIQIMFITIGILTIVGTPNVMWITPLVFIMIELVMVTLSLYERSDREMILTYSNRPRSRENLNWVVISENTDSGQDAGQSES